MDEKLTGLDASLSYLTDEWKEISLLCCKYKPDERPKMSEVVKVINPLLQVCSYHQVSNPRRFLTYRTAQTQTQTKSEVDAGSFHQKDRFRLLDFGERLKIVDIWASNNEIQHFSEFALDNNAFYALKGFSTVKSGILQRKEGNTVRDGKVSLLPNHKFSVYLIGRGKRWL